MSMEGGVCLRVADAIVTSQASGGRVFLLEVWIGSETLLS